MCASKAISKTAPKLRKPWGCPILVTVYGAWTHVTVTNCKQVWFTSRWRRRNVPRSLPDARVEMLKTRQASKHRPREVNAGDFDSSRIRRYGRNSTIRPGIRPLPFVTIGLLVFAFLSHICPGIFLLDWQKHNMQYKTYVRYIPENCILCLQMLWKTQGMLQASWYSRHVQMQWKQL